MLHFPRLTRRHIARARAEVDVDEKLFRKVRLWGIASRMARTQASRPASRSVGCPSDEGMAGERDSHSCWRDHDHGHR